MMAESDFMIIPLLPREATKFIMDKITNCYKPLITKIHNAIQSLNEEASKLSDVFTLCLSQIIKCLMNLFEIFRLEYSSLTNLMESRQCNLDRLSWCYNRLVSLDTYLQKLTTTTHKDLTMDESFHINNMYFVNWIDHAFEILNKLAELVYKTDYKDTEELFEEWKNEMVECVCSLHISIDELLLCAMTLCKYSLPADQTIVKARCQVVLRETKALLGELIIEDLDNSIKPTPESLKLPIMPSNINVMIDVLKDVLYVLETNTNTALLALLINCFSTSMSPVDKLKEHFNRMIKDCRCNQSDDGLDDCPLVAEFDLYNERLLQIGAFAVSCSSDQNRILSLRSGLASLEALDPHLVPALMTSPDSYHSLLLTKSWKKEVEDIRNNVFLIVDPAAFADKSKQMMHQKLLEVLNESSYDNTMVCSVIDVGCVVYDFFNVYIDHEPEALPQNDKLLPLLADLNKVQTECKIVSNLLSKDTDYKYEVKSSKNKETSIEQLHKRLKLFYTLITRINTLLQPKDTDDLFENECEEPVRNVTHTIVKNGNTYVNTPKKNSISRSLFARTNLRSSTRNFPLSKLTKNLRYKNCSQLNFTVQLDRLLSDEDESLRDQLNNVRDRTVLYNFSPIKNRSSLRKVILNRHLQSAKKESVNLDNECNAKGSFLDENDSLQLTQVLNEMTEMTSFLSTTKNITIPFKQNSTFQQKANITKIDINCDRSNITRRIWNIPVNASTVDIPLHEDSLENVSDVNTLERINDLDFVENKLNSLKSQCETSL